MKASGRGRHTQGAVKRHSKVHKQILTESPVQSKKRRSNNTPVKRRVVESLPTVAAEIIPKKPKFEIKDDDEFRDLGWKVILLSQTPQIFLNLEAAARCSERTDGAGIERMARGPGCLHIYIATFKR